jgi:hypothetical protein
VREEVIAHLSPGHFEAINPYGTHNIDVAGVLNRATDGPFALADDGREPYRPIRIIRGSVFRHFAGWGEMPSLVRGLGRDKTARSAGVGACVVPRTSRRLADLLLG